MNPILRTAAAVQAFCDSQGWRSCIIGGVAVQRWAEPRVTRDVDITLLTGFGDERVYIDTLLSEYAPRGTDAAALALARRVLLLQTEDGIGIDVSLGALPFEEMVVHHATSGTVAPGVTLRTCTAEDLLVMKLFAARPLDHRDAEGIVARNGKVLDWAYVEEQLRPLAEAKEEPEIMATLQRLRATGMAYDPRWRPGRPYG